MERGEIRWGGKEIRTLGKDSGSIGRSSEEMDMVSRRHTKGDGGKSHSRRLGELLQTDNGHVDGGAGPGVVRDDLAADTVEHRKQNISTQISCQTRALDARLEFAVVKDPLGILLDVDVKVAVEQCLCGGGGQSRAVLKGLLLAPEPDGLSGTGVGRGGGGLGGGGGHCCRYESERWIEKNEDLQSERLLNTVPNLDSELVFNSRLVFKSRLGI